MSIWLGKNTMERDPHRASLSRVCLSILAHMNAFLCAEWDAKQEDPQRQELWEQVRLFVMAVYSSWPAHFSGICNYPSIVV